MGTVRGLARPSRDTAGGDFHPALRTAPTLSPEAGRPPHESVGDTPLVQAGVTDPIPLEPACAEADRSGCAGQGDQGQYQLWAISCDQAPHGDP